MEYLYAIGFFIIGIYLIYNAIKEFRFLALPGIYFMFLSIWWIVNKLTPDIDLMGGIFGWILRGISVVVLIITGVIYYFKYKRNS